MGINRAVQNAYFNARAIDVSDEMSFEDFRRWLMRFDVNKDGRLSRDELERAIRMTGAWFPKMKARNAIRVAGKKDAGFVHYDEIIDLVEFARKQLDLKIIDP